MSNPSKLRITRDVIVKGKPVKAGPAPDLDQTTITLLRQARAIEDASAEAPAAKK